MRGTGHDTGGEAGFVAAEWSLGIAVLVLPVLLLVAVLPTWAARHEAAAAAAREAARAVVLAGDAAGAAALGVQTAHELLADRGVADGTGPAGADVVVTLPPRDGRGVLPREGVVTVEVSLPGPSVVLPGFGTITAPSVSGSHSRALDPHRTRAGR